MRCVVSYPTRSRPRAVGTRVGVRSVCSPASNGTIVANPRRRRVATVGSARHIRMTSSRPRNRNDASVDTYSFGPVVDSDYPIDSYSVLAFERRDRRSLASILDSVSTHHFTTNTLIARYGSQVSIPIRLEWILFPTYSTDVAPIEFS